MRLGCAAYSYRQYLQDGSMTLDDFMQRAADMWLDGVELTAYYFSSTDDAYLMHLKQRAYRLGLDIFAAAVGNNFCKADPEERAGQVELVKTWTDIAFKLGAPCLRVFAGPLPDGYTEKEARTWTVGLSQGMRGVCGAERRTPGPGEPRRHHHDRAADAGPDSGCRL